MPSSASLLPAIAAIPSLCWMWLFLKAKRIPFQGPGWMLGAAAGAGMIATIPALFVEQYLTAAALPGQEDVVHLLAGPIEETAKLVAVTSGIMNMHKILPGLAHREDQARNLVIYAAAASLAFAGVENLLYVAAHGESLILHRGPVSTAHHLAFGLIWGIGLQKYASNGGALKSRILSVALLSAAATLHSALNLATMHYGDYAPIALLPVSIAWIWIVARKDGGTNKPQAGNEEQYPWTECQSTRTL